MPLSEREVEAKGRDLQKAAASPNSTATVLSILGDLRKGVEATESLLRKTKMGLIVGRLRQHSDKTVQRQASELVGKWKTDVGSKRNSGASTPKPVANGGSPAPSGNGAAASAKGKARLVVPKEKRNAKEDGIKWQLTGNQTRDNCLKLMYDGLAFMSEEAPEDVLKVARSVELAAFNKYQPETSEAYRNKMRSLFQNLKNKSNPDLRTRVYSGQIKPEDFVTYTHEQLKSAERKAEDAKIMKENMDKAMVAQEEKSISTQLQCGKCGQRKVSYNQAQTRSADEPMTTFCECLNCGNRWKFS